MFLAAQVVNRYSVGLPSVEEIGFYYLGKDSVLMNGYQPSKELFFANIGAVDTQVQQNLVSFLHEIDEMDVFFVRNADSYGRFLIARPVYLESRMAFDGVVIYVLDADELLRTFQVNIPSGSNLAIVNSEGQWLVNNATFPVSACEGEAFSKFLADDSKAYFELTYNQERLDIYKYTDDVTGNVFEWCRDDAGREQLAQAPSPWTASSTGDANRRTRGGQAFNNAWNQLYFRVSYRASVEPNKWGTYLGFRVAWIVK